MRFTRKRTRARNWSLNTQTHGSDAAVDYASRRVVMLLWACGAEFAGDLYDAMRPFDR